MGRAEKLEQAKSAIESSRTALTEKTKADQSQLKLSGFPGVIENIKTGTKFTLNITCETEDGTVLTATNGEEQVTGEVHGNQCVLEVYSAGTWNVSDPEGNSCAVKIPENYEQELKIYKPITSGIFGIKIIESEADPYNRVVYTDNSLEREPVTVNQETGLADYHGWDKTWIFDKIYPVMLKTDGTIDYKLNPNDYSQKLDGGESDVANASYDGNAMVCVEKFYTKFSMDGENEVIQISDTKQEGFEAIGFIREDGSEADKIFLSMYLASTVGSYGDICLKSISGRYVKDDTGISDFIKYAKKNGTGYFIEYWAANQIMEALFLILMKNCDSTIPLGSGTYDHETGITDNIGAIGFDPSTKTTKFMYMENFLLEESYHRLVFGIALSSGIVYVKMKPPYNDKALYKTDCISDYDQISDCITLNGTSGYVSKMKCSNKYGRLPVEYNGTESTHEARRWYFHYSNSEDPYFLSNRANNSYTLNIDTSDKSSYMFTGLTYMPPA